MKLLIFILLGAAMAAILSIQSTLPEVLANSAAYILGGLVASLVIRELS